MYYVRGLSSSLKFSLAYFATHCAISYQLMPIIWKAVSNLELTCKLHIIATVSDEAFPNRKFYQMHRLLCENAVKGLVYRTINLYSPDNFIYLFADGPHLIKTACNYL